MKEARLRPLTDEVIALLEAERRTFQLPPPGVADDLATRLGPLLGSPMLPEASAPSMPAEPRAATAIRGANVAGKLGALKAAAMLVVGAAIGGAATVMLQPLPKPEIRYVEVEKIVERAAPTVLSLPSAPSVAPPTVTAAPTRAPSPVMSAVVDSDKALARERALIETARSAVSRSDGPAALAALRGHAQTFPQGRLVEEREALAVQALILSGRREEARAGAVLFEKRFPNGLFLPVVEAALEK